MGWVGQNLWEKQVVSAALWQDSTAIPSNCFVGAYPHSLTHLSIQCLLYTSSCCKHWGYSMSKTDQPLPFQSCSL